MRKTVFSLMLAFPLASAWAADEAERALLSMAAQYDAGKPEQRIRKITYNVAEQSNAQSGMKMYQQTDKFSPVKMFSSAYGNVRRKTTSVKGKSDSHGLILMNHWDLDWRAENAGFTAQNIQIEPPPAQWGQNGGTVKNKMTLSDSNGNQLDWQEQCRLSAAGQADALHRKLRGTVQRASCTSVLGNTAGTIRITQNFEGYYLPASQMFIPAVLVVTNNKTGKIDRTDYQIQHIR